MKWQELTWPQIDALDRGVPVVLPLGSIEQHGHHLPVCTDTAQVDAVAHRLEATLGDRVLVTPTLWLGSSHHHLDLPGTLSLRPTLYSEVVMELVRSVLRVGFQRVFLLNGHGGNETPVAQALTELSDLEPMADSALLAYASWWAVGKPDPQRHGMATTEISHACEYETSLMLHLRPDLVDPKDVKDQQPTLQSPWLQGAKRVALFRRFSRITATGSLGSPTRATAAKGMSLLEAVSGDVASFVEAFADWPLPEVLGPSKTGPA